MDDGETIFFSHSLDTEFGLNLRLRYLFAEAEKRLGEKITQAAFRKFGKPLGARRKAELDGWLLLDRYDTMPEPNVDALARVIADENPDQDVDVIDRKINRWREQRKRMLKAGTWRGPGAPPPVITQAAMIITTR